MQDFKDVRKFNFCAETEEKKIDFSPPDGEVHDASHAFSARTNLRRLKFVENKRINQFEIPNCKACF